MKVSHHVRNCIGNQCALHAQFFALSIADSYQPVDQGVVYGV